MSNEMTVGDMIRFICDNTKERLYFGIEFNEPKYLNKTVYDTLFFPNPDYEQGDGFESLEDYDKCVESDILWTVRWNCKIGGYSVTYGSTLEKALGVMCQVVEEEIKLG